MLLQLRGVHSASQPLQPSQWSMQPARSDGSQICICAPPWRPATERTRWDSTAQATALSCELKPHIFAHPRRGVQPETAEAGDTARLPNAALPVPSRSPHHHVSLSNRSVRTSNDRSNPNDRSASRHWAGDGRGGAARVSDATLHVRGVWQGDAGRGRPRRGHAPGARPPAGGHRGRQRMETMKTI